MEKTRKHCRISALKYPASDKIDSRITTVARSMASTIVPRIPCSPEEEEKMAGIFGMDPAHPLCVYCGRPASHLDHLHPLIEKGFLSGYCSDPGNLVPCCPECNSKKGSSDWEDYMRNNEGITNQDGCMEERMRRLKDFTVKMPARKIDYDRIPGFREMWDRQMKAIENDLKQTRASLEDYRGSVLEEYGLKWDSF